VYVTFNVSPDATDLSPPVKSPAENRIPEVPEDTLAKKAPAIVAVAFITKEDGDAELEITEGFAEVADPKVTALREPV
jgi:hypothetical protein